MTEPATAEVHITVHAPTTTDATQWAHTIAELIRAEHGDHMRLDININTAGPGTCGASLTGVSANPLGPCVLRDGHDGPVHQGATGAKWWLEEQPPARREIHPGDWLPGYRTEADFDAAPPPQFTGILGMTPDACACGGTMPNHAPDCPVHPARLRWAAEQATAQLPQELRDAGVHFEYVTTTADAQPVQCWHIEPGTPCDYDRCQQPDRIARGDYGTDPRTTTED